MYTIQRKKHTFFHLPKLIGYNGSCHMGSFEKGYVLIYCCYTNIYVTTYWL